MQRVTISLDESLAAAFDGWAKEKGYQNRSEAVRDLVRQAIDARRLTTSDAGGCVANLSCIFDHRARDIANRLTDIAHENHDLVVSTVQVPLDHATGFVSMILKGPIGRVRALADGVAAERGVRFGAVNVVSVEPNDDHEAAGAHTHHGHAHLSPRTI